MTSYNDENEMSANGRLLARIDERTRNIEATLDRESTALRNLIEHHRIERDRELAEMKRNILDLQKSVNQLFVTRTEFQPVKNYVYGIVALISIAVLGALITLVLIRPGLGVTGV